MSRRRKAVIAVAVTGLIVLGAVAWWLMPLVTGPALPAGATRLHITTESPSLPFVCAAAALSPARVSTSGDELILVAAETGNPINVVWPSGFRRLAAGRTGGPGRS